MGRGALAAWLAPGDAVEGDGIGLEAMTSGGGGIRVDGLATFPTCALLTRHNSGCLSLAEKFSPGGYSLNTSSELSRLCQQLWDGCPSRTYSDVVGGTVVAAKACDYFLSAGSCGTLLEMGETPRHPQRTDVRAGTPKLCCPYRCGRLSCGRNPRGLSPGTKVDTHPLDEQFKALVGAAKASPTARVGLSVHRNHRTALAS